MGHIHTDPYSERLWRGDWHLNPEKVDSAGKDIKFHRGTSMFKGCSLHIFISDYRHDVERHQSCLNRGCLCFIMISS